MHGVICRARTADAAADSGHAEPPSRHPGRAERRSDQPMFFFFFLFTYSQVNIISIEATRAFPLTVPEFGSSGEVGVLRNHSLPTSCQFLQAARKFRFSLVLSLFAFDVQWLAPAPSLVNSLGCDVHLKKKASGSLKQKSRRRGFVLSGTNAPAFVSRCTFLGSTRTR